MTFISIEGVRIYIVISTVVPSSLFEIVRHLECLQFIIGNRQTGKAPFLPRQYFPQNYSSIHAPGMIRTHAYAFTYAPPFSDLISRSQFLHFVGW